MKIQPYITRLSSSSEFKNFQKQNKDAFMMAGFFVIDFESGKNLHQIDYYIPSTKKVAAFTLDGGVKLQLLDSPPGAKKAPQQLDMQTKIDLDAIHGILEDEMKNRSITEDIKKIIAVIQNIDGKKIWNINCVLSGMGILKAHIEDESESVLKMEKASIMDYVKKMPPAMLAKLQGAAGQSEKDIDLKAKDKLKQLDALGKALEAEKKKFQEEIKKESSVKVKSVKSKSK